MINQLSQQQPTPEVSQSAAERGKVPDPVAESRLGQVAIATNALEAAVVQQERYAQPAPGAAAGRFGVTHATYQYPSGAGQEAA